MARLFIRFYLGVLVTLAIAWAVETYVYRYRSAAEGTQLAETIVGGGARLVRKTLEDAEDRDAKLAELNQMFDFPVNIVNLDLLPQKIRDRFDRGDDVVVPPGTVMFSVTPLSNGTEALVFGGVPLSIEASQLEVMTGYGGVMLAAAAIIALMLKPVATQLHVMERTATAIAGGQFDARVDEGKVRSAAKLAHAFNLMADHVESLLGTQREMLQAVSHELRTPLARIHFAIDLMRDSASDADREQRMNAVENAAGDLDELVGELLQYVRMSTRQPHMEVEDVALLPLVEDVIEKLSVLHPAVDFAIGEELHSDSFTVCAHRPHLVRVLTNLLGNAGKFAESQVVITASHKPEGVRIDVDDDGPGVPEADRFRVFEPFVRSEESEGGAGLGLALVERIVARHNGEVSALESPLGGARFQVLWPSADDPAASTSHTAEPITPNLPA